MHTYVLGAENLKISLTDNQTKYFRYYYLTVRNN